MTANTAQLAATLSALAALLAEQQTPAPLPTEESTVRQLSERVLLTVEEAAQQLGIGRTKTYELIHNGDLESVQIGRLRRVPKSAIDDYTSRLIQQNA